MWRPDGRPVGGFTRRQPSHFPLSRDNLGSVGGVVAAWAWARRTHMLFGPGRKYATALFELREALGTQSPGPGGVVPRGLGDT